MIGLVIIYSEVYLGFAHFKV